MHTVSTTVYKYSELNTKAKDKANNQLQDILYDCFSLTVDEVIESLKVFCEHFDFELDGWSCDGYTNRFKINLGSFWDRYADVEGFIEDDGNTNTIGELTNLELVPVLIQRYSHNSFKYSKINLFTFVNDKLTVNDKLDCPFTGMCYDMDLIEALKDFVAELYNATQSTNIEYLIYCIKSKLDKTLNDEYNCTFSEESISDYCDCNDMHFTEYGVLFNN